MKLAQETERIVTKNNLRKYYRFRAALFYGGISRADCVGCNLSCVFCWAFNIVRNPEKFGKFYLPEEVAKELVKIAKKKGFSQVRISGNEPTISKEHLIKISENIPKEFTFILETNGILIGANKDFAKGLSKFKNLHVRVALKGTTPEEFSKLTGVKPEFFNLPLKALENLTKAGVSCHPALIELVKEKRKEILKKN